MSKKIPAAKAHRFLAGGMAGTHPGKGNRGLQDTSPWPRRPKAGYAMRECGGNRRPPKGNRP